jgi:hypothetical protein
MKKLALPTLCLIILISCSAFAQDKITEDNAPPPSGACNCKNDSAPKCSASISCANGGAMCSCTEGGCNSYCATGAMGEFPDGKTLLGRLQAASENEISAILTKALGKKVSFTPYRENSKLDYAIQPKSHWSILEYLSQNGDLKINGVDYSVWNTFRNTITAGKGNFCVGNMTVERFVNEISFFSGKKYQVVSGNSNLKVDIPIKELTIDEVIETLQRQYQLSIQ